MNRFCNFNDDEIQIFNSAFHSFCTTESYNEIPQDHKPLFSEFYEEMEKRSLK